jgi:hypothetical protein
MKTRTILMLLLLLAAACAPASKRVTDAFVMQYIQSIVEGSEFYKKYSTPQDLKLIALARPKMQGDFRISGWDYVGPGRSEYAMSFANGAVAIVAVEEQGGVVRSATLTLNRQPLR